MSTLQHFLTLFLPVLFLSSLSHSEPPLRMQIGQMLMVGFEGTSPQDKEVQQFAKLIREGQLGNIIFFGYNLQSPQQAIQLTSYFKSTSTPHPVFLAVDQEGGKVQRLNSKNQFRDFLSAKKASLKSKDYYKEMARMVADSGFNMVLGPVVDLEYNLKNQKPCPVIGSLERSFSPDPIVVVEKAGGYIQVFNDEGVTTCLKHFPGHGYAQKDSHKGLVDVTQTHDPVELEPFYRLIAENKADAIMTAHLMNARYDPDLPATLSYKTLNGLLRQKGYDGVIISDCLHMGAIENHYDLKTRIILALKAGVDILILSNNSGASIHTEQTKTRTPSPQLIKEVITIIEDAIQTGEISETQIQDSYRRIVRLKEKHRGK